jgi:4-oxalocrotonate tautomerase
MPLITVRMVEGHSKERKDEMARRITAAISEVGAVPADIVWVTFEDVPAGEWYIGAESVESARKGAASGSSKS